MLLIEDCQSLWIGALGCDLPRCRPIAIRPGVKELNGLGSADFQQPELTRTEGPSQAFFTFSHLTLCQGRNVRLEGNDSLFRRQAMQEQTPEDLLVKRT
jgi:hypothetical protein